MAPTCLYAFLTSSGHVPDETADGVLGIFSQTWIKGMNEHFDSLWSSLGAWHALVPEVFNWNQVWGTWGPVSGITAFVTDGITLTRVFLLYYMCVVWTCSDLWRELGTGSAVHWWIPSKLHGAGLWGEVPLKGYQALMIPLWSLFLNI